MNRKNASPVSRQSENPLAQGLEALKKLFPEAASEDSVDIEALADLLGVSQVSQDRTEKYSFTWWGKQEALRALAQPSQATLKAAPDESLNWEDTGHIFIEGENLEVLKLLHKSYAGRVKMIYIDPPYNTGKKDYVYPDNYAEPYDNYLRETGQVDENGNTRTSQPEKNGRKHSNWLSMMYPRLALARQLLRDDGVIFVSIDDNEVHHLRLLMDMVFGEENFVAEIVWHSKYTQANDTRWLSRQHEYLLLLAKYKSSLSKLRVQRPDSMNASYSNSDNDPRGPWKPTPLHAKSGSKNYLHIFSNGYKWQAPAGRYPRYSLKRLTELEKDNRISFGKDGASTPNVKTFLGELDSGVVSGSIWSYKLVGHTHGANEEVASLLGKGVFDNPKPTNLVIRMLQLGSPAQPSPAQPSPAQPSPAQPKNICSKATSYSTSSQVRRRRLMPFSSRTARTAASAVSSWCNCRNRWLTPTTTTSPKWARSAFAA